MVIVAGAAGHAPEGRPQGQPAVVAQSVGQAVRDLVTRAAAQQRLGMGDQGDAARRPGRRVGQHFHGAGRAGEKMGFGFTGGGGEHGPGHEGFLD